MSDENKFTRVNNKKEVVYKKRTGLIIIILILLIIISLFISSFFIKDNNDILYIDKIKMLLTKKNNNNLNDNPNNNLNNISNIENVDKNNSKYKLEDYLIIEERKGSNDNFKYQYVVFTNRLPNNLYKDFVLEQDIFVDKTTEKNFEKRKLESYAEIYDDILFIYSIQTYYIEKMPTFSNILTLIIDLNNNTLMSNNEIIAKFDYNPVGLYVKVLENILKNTKAETYYLEDGVTKVSKEELNKNIQVYAHKLTDVQDLVVRFFIKDKKLYILFTEPLILQFLNLTYDKGTIDETAKIMELYITN